MPAHAQSPQMTKVPLSSFQRFPSSVEGLLVLAREVQQLATVNFFYIGRQLDISSGGKRVHNEIGHTARQQRRSGVQILEVLGPI